MGSSQSTSNETDTTQVILENDDDGEVKISKRRLSREELDSLSKELQSNLSDRNVTIDMAVYKSIGADLGIEFDDDDEEEEEEEEYYDEMEPYELVEPIETPDSFSMVPGMTVNQIGYVGALELPPLYPGMQSADIVTDPQDEQMQNELTSIPPAISSELLVSESDSETTASDLEMSSDTDSELEISDSDHDLSTSISSSDDELVGTTGEQPDSVEVPLPSEKVEDANKAEIASESEPDEILELPPSIEPLEAGSEVESVEVESVEVESVEVESVEVESVDLSDDEEAVESVVSYKSETAMESSESGLEEVFGSTPEDDVNIVLPESISVVPESSVTRISDEPLPDIVVEPELTVEEKQELSLSADLEPTVEETTPPETIPPETEASISPAALEEEEPAPVELAVIEPAAQDLTNNIVQEEAESEPTTTPPQAIDVEPIDSIETVEELEPVEDGKQEVVVSEEPEIESQPPSIFMLPVTDELELITESLTPEEPEVQEVDIPEVVIPGPVAVKPTLLEPVYPVSPIEEPADSTELEPEQPILVEQGEIADQIAVEQGIVEDPVTVETEVVLPAENISIEEASVAEQVPAPELVPEESTVEAVDMPAVIDLVGEAELADILEDHLLLSESVEQPVLEESPTESVDSVSEPAELSQELIETAPVPDESPSELVERSPDSVEIMPENIDSTPEPLESTPELVEPVSEPQELVEPMLDLDETSSVPVETSPEAVQTLSEAIEIPSVAVEISSEEVDTPSEAVETPSEAVDTPSEAVETPSEAVETSSEAVETPSEAVESLSEPITDAESVSEANSSLFSLIQKAIEPYFTAIKDDTNAATEQGTQTLPEPETVLVAEPESVLVAEPETVLVAEPETVLVAEPETVLVAEPETVLVAEPETVLVAEPETVLVAEPETVLVAAPETVLVPEPVPEHVASVEPPVQEPIPVESEIEPVVEVTVPAPVIETPIEPVSDTIPDQTNELTPAENLAQSLFGEYKKQEVEKIISEAKEDGARNQARIDADAMSNALNAERSRWRSRFSVIESNLQKRKQDISSAHGEGFDLVTSKLQIPETEETCSNNVSDLVDCYLTNPDQVLRCNQIAQSFDSCVNKALSSR